MLSIAFLMVLGSGFVHSVWNLFTKKSLNKNVFLWFCQWVGIVVFLPWTLMEWSHADLTGIGLWLVLASVVLHGGYVLLLAAAYSVGDLSQVYPIMRGTSPMLVPLLGVGLFGESLSATGWLGVFAIVVGIMLLSDWRASRSSSRKAILLAVAVGIFITGYILLDKMAVAYVPAVVLNEATNLGNALALTWATLRSGGIRRELRVNGKIMLLGGVLAPGGYLIFLYALSLAPVAQIAPMREIGIVFGTLMGIFILREPQGRRRIAASLLITLGIITLGVWG